MIDFTQHDWLRSALAERSMTIAELARLSEVNRATIHRIANGKGGTVATLRKLVDALSA